MEEPKAIRLRIPEFLEDFYTYFTDEEYIKCATLKYTFYVVWNSLNDSNKIKIKDYMVEYLHDNEIDLDLDLNGEFKDVIDFQVVTPATQGL